jgi:hypothetical protein
MAWNGRSVAAGADGAGATCALARDRPTNSGFYDERYSRTTFAAPFNDYQAGSFERTQGPSFRVGLDFPLLQHDVGNNKGVGLPKFPKVPNCQPNQ